MRDERHRGGRPAASPTSAGWKARTTRRPTSPARRSARSKPTFTRPLDARPGRDDVQRRPDPALDERDEHRAPQPPRPRRGPARRRTSARAAPRAPADRPRSAPRPSPGRRPRPRASLQLTEPRHDLGVAHPTSRSSRCVAARNSARKSATTAAERWAVTGVVTAAALARSSSWRSGATTPSSPDLADEPLGLVAQLAVALAVLRPARLLDGEGEGSDVIAVSVSRPIMG